MFKLIHDLKIWPDHFKEVVSGNKKVEIRCEQDREFNVDDILHLREFDDIKQQYSGRNIFCMVTHCLRGQPWVPDGYVAMSISQVFINESQVYGNDCPNGMCDL